MWDAQGAEQLVISLLTDRGPGSKSVRKEVFTGWE